MNVKNGHKHTTWHYFFPSLYEFMNEIYDGDAAIESVAHTGTALKDIRQAIWSRSKSKDTTEQDRKDTTYLSTLDTKRDVWDTRLWSFINRCSRNSTILQTPLIHSREKSLRWCLLISLRCKIMNEHFFEWSSAEKWESEKKKIVQCHLYGIQRCSTSDKPGTWCN